MAGERDILLDPVTGDMVLAGGGSFSTGEVAIAQELRIRYRTVLGEHFLDDTRGLPWLTWGSSKMTDVQLREVEALLLEQTLATLGVVRVERPGITATFDTEAHTVTASGTAVTDEGLLIPINEEIPLP